MRDPYIFDDKPVPEELVYIASEHNLDYYVAINPHPVQYEQMAEIKIEVPLGVLKKRYEEAQRRQHAIESQLKVDAKNTMIWFITI